MKSEGDAPFFSLHFLCSCTLALGPLCGGGSSSMSSQQHRPAGAKFPRNIDLNDRFLIRHNEAGRGKKVAQFLKFLKETTVNLEFCI